MKLSDAKIRNAKADDSKDYKIADGGGLYLLVKSNGTKCFRFKYRMGAKEKVLALGTYPVTSIAEARNKLLEAKKLIANGQDPNFKKQEDKRLAAFKLDNTFQSVAKEWHKTNKTKWTDDHANRLWRRLELHILPEIGSKPISEIKSLELLGVLKKVEKRGTNETSRRLLQTCNAIFSYGVLTGRLENNPAPNLAGALTPHKAKNYPTITAKELPKFFADLENVETTRLNKYAIWLIMFTFVRQGELRQAKWQDIDFDAQEWRIPAETTKMREIHIVPLAKQAIELLHKIQDITGEGEFIFPSQQLRKHQVMSENTINRVINRMGYKGKLVGHGFRALASTTLNEMGFKPDVIERQLAHMERNKIRAAYNRAEYMPERTKMMQHWADYLENIATCNKVLPFRRANSI